MDETKSGKFYLNYTNYKNDQWCQCVIAQLEMNEYLGKVVVVVVVKFDQMTLIM